MPLRGFLAPPTDQQPNYFREFIHKAGGTLATVWPGAKVHSFSFGKGDPQPVPDLIRFESPEAFNQRQTFIDRPILHSTDPDGKRPQLKIILTDLFQNEGDVARLSPELDNRYVKDESRAVGVLGIRSVFDGSMDDLPGKVPAGAADSLPFYFLIAGNIADVRHAIDVLTTQVVKNGLPKDQHLALVFTKKQGSQVERRLKVLPADPQRPGYRSMGTLVAGAAERGIPMIQPNREVKLKLESFPDKEFFAMGPHLSIGNAQESLEKKATVFRNGVKPEVNDAPALTVEPDMKTLIIDPERLPPKSITLFELDVYAKPGDYAGIEPWGLELEEARKVVQNQKFDLDPKTHSRPGRTPNLRFFLQMLGNAMFQKNKILLGRYYLYVSR